SLISNMQSEALERKQELFDGRIEEAMNQMRFHEKLTGYTSTSEFIDELSKYLKINERCDSENLVDCYYSEFLTSDDEIYNVETLTTGDTFVYSSGDYDHSSPTESVVFADGSQAIISYDLDCEWLDPYEIGLNRSQATDCVAMIYDVNGSKGKNTMGDDVSNINSNFKLCFDDGLCWTTSNISITSLNTCNGSEWDDNYTSTINFDNCATNNWAGAKKACDDIDMRLPTSDEFASLAQYLYDLDEPSASGTADYNASVFSKINLLNSSTGYWLWTSDEYVSNSSYAYSFNYNYTGFGINGHLKYGGPYTRCVSDKD
ncbi:MAG: hypothetical protein R3Y28_01750, partial [Candidatus Gastranaerophilales bacterium]